MAQLVNEEILQDFIANELSSDREFFQNLLKIFVVFLGELELVKYDGSEENLDKLKNLAHKIKSSCQSYGAEALRSALLDLELACKAGEKEKVKLHYSEVLNLLGPTLESINLFSNLFFNGEKKSG